MLTERPTEFPTCRCIACAWCAYAIICVASLIALSQL